MPLNELKFAYWLIVTHGKHIVYFYMLAATHLTTGEECNLDYDSENGLICDPTLVCDACDGADGPDVCQMPTAA